MKQSSELNIHPRSVLIIGASARAAAWSVHCSGLARPWCIDLFADADLRRNGPARAITGAGYPNGFLEAARQAPPRPWLYTGALENHPALIDALTRERPLWGNDGDVVRKVRSPELVAAALARNGLPALAVMSGAPLETQKHWLVKPRRSAGGAHIRFWQGEPIASSYYGQEWVEGVPCSALFCGRRDGSAQFLGATRQLIGAGWLRARPFRYCGNIGPLVLADGIKGRLRRIGAALTQVFSLRGFFGVDYIAQGEVPWLVEINPRLTAGLEVLERAAGRSFFPYHCEAFLPTGDAPEAFPASDGRLHGKAILFARAPLTFPANGPWLASIGRPWSSDALTEYADIPSPDARIARRQPILTIFALGSNEADCLERLRQNASAVERRLFGGRPSTPE